MTFPVMWFGKPLFRDNKLAMSESCCCNNVFECIGCKYFYYSFAIVDNLTFAPGPAPEAVNSTLYFYRSYTTPIDDPVFAGYNGHLWIWEACTYSRGPSIDYQNYGQLSSLVEEFHAENSAAAGQNADTLIFGECSPSGGFGSTNYWKDSMQHAFEPPATATTVIHIDEVPPNWSECLPIRT